MFPHYEVPAGSVIPVPFATYNSSGASVTLTGLAVTDVEVYKFGSGVTQRSSDAGYALIDTDGIDVDGITGIHGFTIDTSDNTDAGFYAAGTLYHVVVSAVTVDSQTVNFIACSFRLMAAEQTAGYQSVTIKSGVGTGEILTDAGRARADVRYWDGAAVATPATAGYPYVTIKSGTGTGEVNLSSGRAAADVTYWSGTAVAAVDTAGYPKVTIKDGTGTGELELTNGKVDIAASGINASSFAAGAVNAAALATDAVSEITAAIKALVIETNGSITVGQALSVILAATAGVTSSGGAVLEDPSGTSTRITATINGSNERTAMTLTPSA
jgi:hypothetical protein